MGNADNYGLFFKCGPITYTDGKGKYVLKHRIAIPVHQYQLCFMDIDGNRNGVFETVVKDLEIEKNELTGAKGRWYKGYVDYVVNTVME